MPVAIAGLALKSVSFLPVETGIDDFERSVLRGPALIEGLCGTASVGGGFIAVLEEAAAEIVPLLYTDCFAAGPAADADAAFEAYRDEIIAGLAAEAGRLDGVLLYLHGAMTNPTRTAPDLEVVMAVRRSIGPDLTTLPYHNVPAGVFPVTAD